MTQGFDPEARPDRARAIRLSRIILAVFCVGLAIAAAIWLAVGGSGNYGPPPLVIAEPSPERLPPDPNKTNGAEIPHTSQKVYGIVGGGEMQSEKQGIAPEEEKLMPFPGNQSYRLDDRVISNGPIQLLPPASNPERINPQSLKEPDTAPPKPSAKESVEDSINSQAHPQPPRRENAGSGLNTFNQKLPPAGQEKAVTQPKPKQGAGKAFKNAFFIQIGAVRTKTIAQTEWKRLKDSNKDILGSMQLFIQEVEVEGRGTFHRMQAGPLPDKTLAEIVCSQLKSRGAGCFVVAK